MLQIPRYTPETPSRLKLQIPATEMSGSQIARPRRRSSASSISLDEDRSIVQAYCLAGKVRAKLRREVDRPIGNLRRLVGHVNVLDDIMDVIHDDEMELESDFPDFSVLEREQSDSSSMLLQSMENHWTEEDYDMEEPAQSSDQESGWVIQVREIHEAPRRPPPPPPKPAGLVS